MDVPPSLANIFKEIERDLGHARPSNGYLVPWARQGVLLLNAVLTVEAGRAGAHQGKGWEGFTDHIVECLNRGREGLVFMLWGFSLMIPRGIKAEVAGGRAKRLPPVSRDFP